MADYVELKISASHECPHCKGTGQMPPAGYVACTRCKGGRIPVSLTLSELAKMLGLTPPASTS